MNTLFNNLDERLTANATSILIILLVTLVFRTLGSYVLGRLIKKTSTKGKVSRGERQRQETILHILRSTFGIVVWLLAGLMVLSELGISIAPLLAGAGIAGLAFGFGGQYLVRDVIAGLFIIAENQYRVGDVVCLDGTCGLVEDISLRMTILRDLDGTVHYIPNGVAEKTSNMSMGYARINLDVGVDYSSDLAKVVKVINRVGEDLAEDENWKNAILEPPQFLRVDSFADSAIIIKILGKTVPLQQWDVAGELRTRLKLAFDKEGIVIPFPQRVIHETKN